jgi:hypothetical protein
MKIELTEETIDVKVVLLCGLRACMGSGSYAAGCGIDFIKSNWSDLPGQMQKNIARDLLKWLGEEHLTTNDKKQYRAEWFALMQFINEKSPDVVTWAAGSNLCERERMAGVDEFFEVKK